ncbi:hypothetical protein [Nonomuraea sp. bgisy101]|uniref:hypothetical protein n=1 Tax=Nonomuraea sp. bgisy101 TaxID=3413784 RepID=UPI003D70F8C2
MKKARAAVLMVVVAFLAVIGIVASPVLTFVTEGRCGEEYDRIDEALVPFDILDARPPGAVPHGERGSGCDTDDYFASVDRSYRPARQQTSQEDVVSYYRAIALRHGWQVVSGEGSPDGEECVVKGVEGSQVQMSVWFPPDAGGDYSVSVSTWPCDR